MMILWLLFGIFLAEPKMLHEIIPVPIFSNNNCNEYAKKGFGDKRMMYEQENCEEILNNTMFCTEWKNIKCLNVKTQNCSENRKTCENVSPIILNDTHFLVYPLHETNLFGIIMKPKTNYLVSAKENYSFSYENIQFTIKGIAQEVLFEVKSLQIEKFSGPFWIREYTYFAIIGTLTSVLISFCITFWIIKCYKKKAQNANTRTVRVNRSKVYFRTPGEVSIN